MNTEQLKIYTDGSCNPNPGLGGYAWIALDGRLHAGGETKSTNNRMELMAVIHAIESNADRDLVIYSDSQYVINGATKWYRGWLRNNWKDGTVANRDLWERLLAALSKTNVKFEWVRGHSGNPMNEAVDELANVGRLQAGRQS
jgi:ribonuclease HI